MDAYEFMKMTGEMASRTQQLYIDFAKNHGLNYNTLAVLYTSYINKGCTQKRITVEWYVPKQTVNTICKELIAKGLLTKVKGDKDHRETIVSLTEKGVEFAAPIVNKLLEIESGVMAHLGDDGSHDFIKIYSAYTIIMEAEFSKAEKSK